MAERVYGLTERAEKYLRQMMSEFLRRLPYADRRTRRVFPNHKDSNDSIPAGECTCCGGCACYPDDPMTDCEAVPCLTNNYRILGRLPFTSETILAHDSGCVYETNSFEVIICEESWGTHYWRLTVAAGVHDSVLELIRTGTAGADIPLVYKGMWYFNPICGNEFQLVFDCDMPPEIAHAFPVKVCVNSTNDSCEPCPIPDIIGACCAEGFPAVMQFTPTLSGSLPCADTAWSGSTVIVTYNRTYTVAGNTFYEWIGTITSSGACGGLTVVVAIGDGCAWQANIFSGTVTYPENLPASGSLCTSLAASGITDCPIVSESLSNILSGWNTINCTCCGVSSNPTITATLTP